MKKDLVNTFFAWLVEGELFNACIENRNYE